MKTKTLSEYHTAEKHLSKIDSDWKRLIKNIGPCRLQKHPAREPYEALIRAIAYQQLHGRAGDAIIARFLNLYPDDDFPTPSQLLATPFDTLKTCGFSTRKIETIFGIAEASLSGVVPKRSAAMKIDNEKLITRLTTLRGIGRWTVEILLMFTLDRMDILPADDFGVKDGYRILKSLEKPPTSKEMAAIGMAFKPYRTIASWYLWQVPRPPKVKQ